jgi:hypothetical protein
VLGQEVILHQPVRRCRVRTIRPYRPPGACFANPSPSGSPSRRGRLLRRSRRVTPAQRNPR